MEQEKNIAPEEIQASVQETCAGCQGGCCGAESPAPAEEKPVTVVDVHFRDGGKVYYFSPQEFTLEAGDAVIIDTARGPEFGICAAGNHTVSSRDVVQPLRKVLRRATEQDIAANEQNRRKEREALQICQKKVSDRGLDMQMVSAEYAFDGSKLLFFFTSEGRVDFRELVKDLASQFHTRIELRQIGVRDKAKMVGGLGICGRPFCCREFLDDFQPVSIKMAKTQNLSLNPTKISGTCGRLMCCLKYEQDAYEDLIRTAPKADSFVDTPDGRGTVSEVNLLRQNVKVRMEKAPETVNTYKNDEIYVIRSGKAKKTDPPIPEDFAPISSQRQAPRRRLDLEPMPEVVLSSEKQPAREGGERSGHNGHRRHGKPQDGERRRQEQTAAPAPQKEVPAPEASKNEGGEAAARSRNRRRRRSHHRKSGEGSAPAGN